jgi:hypothetical protein
LLNASLAYRLDLNPHINQRHHNREGTHDFGDARKL